jgi:hypothetical protein
MIDNRIINLFRQFARVNKLEYDEKPIPYRPYGEVRGIVGNNLFKIYLYQIGTVVSTRLNTVFVMSGFDLLPEGFCIEHVGGLNCKNKTFDEQIQVRSYDVKIVKNYLNGNKKSILLEVFNEIHKIENSIFKVRCTFRVSDNDISISVDKIFQDLDEFNKAYLAVLPLFTSLILNLK